MMTYVIGAVLALAVCGAGTIFRLDRDRAFYPIMMIVIAAFYGFFAVVIGLLWWIYLGAQVTLLCAEVNVVRKRHLWPRGLTAPPLTDADKRALVELAKEEERRPDQRVEVRFNEPTPPRPATR